MGRKYIHIYISNFFSFCGGGGGGGRGALVSQDDGSNRRTSSRKQQRTPKKPRTSVGGVAGDQDASTERKQVARAIAARKFKRLRQELVSVTPCCTLWGGGGGWFACHRPSRAKPK